MSPARVETTVHACPFCAYRVPLEMPPDTETVIYICPSCEALVKITAAAARK